MCLTFTPYGMDFPCIPRVLTEYSLWFQCISKAPTENPTASWLAEELPIGAITQLAAPFPPLSRGWGMAAISLFTCTAQHTCTTSALLRD